MKKILLTSLVFAAAMISTKAFAYTDWYQFNYGDSTCDRSAGSVFPNPQAAIDWLRSQSEIPTTQITRSPADNSIMAVEIDFQNAATNTPASFAFFASDALCEGYRSYLIDKNLAATPNELR